MSKKSHTTTAPWGPAQSQLLGAGSTIQNAYNASQPNTQRISDGISAQLPGLNAQAFGQQPGLSQATGYNNDVLGGKYLGQSNPYMQGMLNNTNQLVGNAINQNFSMAGRTGSGNHEYALANGLANADNSMQYQNYSNERNAMSTAAGQMPGLVNAQYAGILPAMTANSGAAELPFTGLNNLGQIGSLYSPYSQTTQRKSFGQNLQDLMLAGAATARSSAGAGG